MYIVSKNSQPDLSSSFYLYLEFYNSDLGESNPIRRITPKYTTFMKDNIPNAAFN